MRSLLDKIKFLFMTDEQKQEFENTEYSKLIANFTRPEDDKKRIGQKIEGLIEYDLVDSVGENQIVGHLLKRFVRLHKGYFKNLVKDIAESVSDAYVIYLDKNQIASGDVPENLSVLLKQLQRTDFFTGYEDLRKLYNEQVTPKILNFFGCKTVYNATLKQEPFDKYVLSLDFIGENERFYVAKPLNVKNGKDLPVHQTYRIEDKLKELDLQLGNLSKAIYEKYGRKPKINRAEIVREFLYSYLVRGVLVGDRDFNERNYGFIYDEKTNNVRFAPNFDFELAFDRNSRTTQYCVENLEFIRKKHPQLFEVFMYRLNYLTLPEPETGYPLYRKILADEIVEPDLLEHFTKVFSTNAQFLEEFASGKIKPNQNQPT